MLQLDLHFTAPVSTNTSQIESTFLYRAVKWFRAEDQSNQQKTLRKIAAFTAAFFLCLTGIGILVVINAAREWERQANFLKIPVSLPEEEEAILEKEEEIPSTKTIETNIVFVNLTPVSPKVLKKEEPKPEPISVTPVVKKVEIEIPVRSEGGYPKPFETLKNLINYTVEEQEEIKAKVNRALKRNVLRSYDAIKQAVSKEVLEKLFDEAKILAHYWAMKDNPEDTPPADIYKSLVVTNLDMLFRGLANDKKFPNLDF